MRNCLHFAFAFTLALAPSCAVDSAPEGLRRTPSGPGAEVVFNLTHRPLPEIPLPNDVATFADPTSRTGRRINASIAAPTSMERHAREALTMMEGWGTYAPIAVSFARSQLSQEAQPAIDLDEVYRRTHGDEFDFSNDPIYLINLRTGVPAVLDMGSGSLPAQLEQPELYWENDYQKNESSLLFETREEGAGKTQYDPALDTDFDGNLDHPNTLGQGARDTYDNLLTWYERETDTLILKPLLPLEEKTEYAVVLTDRLRGSDGNPVRSPFEFIHHAAQKDSVARVRDILADGNRKNYYGDVAGTGLDRVAFVWTFTTQPVQEDLRLIRDGLYGRGRFSRLASQFPSDFKIRRAASLYPGGADVSGWESDPACARRIKTAYMLNLADPEILKLFGDIVVQVRQDSPGRAKAFLDALSHIDHIVTGTYQSPYFQQAPEAHDPDARFHVNMKTGDGDIRSDTVQFWLYVPKARPGMKQPFPMTMFSHGYSSSAIEALNFAGEFARQGLATFAINGPQHGLVLDPASKALLDATFAKSCLAGIADAVVAGRAYDRNGDGTEDSAAWYWTSHIFRVRDNVRQFVVDLMQAVRTFRSFDGTRRGTEDYNGDGIPELAGDFDADGVPDVGGTAQIGSAGGSLGGIISQIHGGIDPGVTAAVPVVGGGGLTDIAMRSYGVATAVVQQMLTPLLIGVPATARVAKDQQPTRCAPADRSVRVVVNDARNSVEVELACLRPDELNPGMTVVVTNVATGEVRCGGTGHDGRFRVPIPATRGDRLDVQVYPTPHAVTSYKTCELRPGVTPGRRIQTFEQAATIMTPIADPTIQCAGDLGCAQFMDRLFPVGSPLVSPHDGLGLRRQTPEMRRLIMFAQAGLDPGDPINYAPYYMIRPLLDENGNVAAPRAVLNVPSVGDNFVPTATGIAFSRAAGIVPFLPPSAAERFPEYIEYVTPKSLYDVYGKTPNQVLIDGHVVEGISRLARHPAGPACAANYVPGPECTANETLKPDACAQALFDADWPSEGRLPFDQQHPAVPLRLARRVDIRPTDMASLERSWEPRLEGAPFTGKGWSASSRVAAHLTMYSQPEGVHGWGSADTCRKWNPTIYGMGLLTRFVASGGTDPYYLSHPRGHLCLERLDCDFFK